MTFEDLDILILVLNKLNLDYLVMEEEITVKNISYKLKDYRRVSELINIIKQDNNIIN